MATPQEKIPIWLDCDPGHDDAFALLLSLHHPRLHLLGVSTIHGNAPLTRTTGNALSLLTAFGRSDIPVFPGAAKPFCREARSAPDIHGESGLDGTDLLPRPTSLAQSSTSALFATRESIVSQPPGTVWVIATGALTNIALLFAAFPELVEHIAGLSIMGGAIGGNFTDAPMGKFDPVTKEWKERVGNVSMWAEFNIYCDPESAHSLLSSNTALAAKTTLITLDLTHQVLATPSVLESLLHRTPLSDPPSSEMDVETSPSPLRQMLHSLLAFFSQTYNSVFGLASGPPLHDPLAVAVILDTLGVEDFGFDDGPPPAREGYQPSLMSGPAVRGRRGGTRQVDWSEMKADSPSRVDVRPVRWVLKVVTAGETAHELVRGKTPEGPRTSHLGRTVIMGEAEAGLSTLVSGDAMELDVDTMEVDAEVVELYEAVGAGGSAKGRRKAEGKKKPAVAVTDAVMSLDAIAALKTAKQRDKAFEERKEAMKEVEKATKERERAVRAKLKKLNWKREWNEFGSDTTTEGGVRIPRQIKKVERFWEVLFEAVESAEEATRGGDVWKGW